MYLLPMSVGGTMFTFHHNIMCVHWLPVMTKLTCKTQEQPLIWHSYSWIVLKTSIFCTSWFFYSQYSTTALQWYYHEISILSHPCTNKVTTLQRLVRVHLILLWVWILQVEIPPYAFLGVTHKHIHTFIMALQMSLSLHYHVHIDVI